MIRRFQQSRQALGSMAIITLTGELSRDQQLQTYAGIWQTIELFERRFSRFLAQSELTAFNNAAGSQVAVSTDFRRLLETSKEMAILTTGLFNPFILPELQRAGYKTSWVDPENRPASYEERQMVPIEALRLETAGAQIPADSAIEFGGIGKGYLLDLLQDQLQSQPLHGYWVSLGGDILCQGFDLDGPWRIEIQAALNGDQPAGVYENTTGKAMAIATSGVTKRRGVVNGRPWHHLIDPRTGRPASTDLLTATVVCREATRADVYAKCLVILDSEQAEAFTRDHNEILGTLLQYEPVTTNQRAPTASGLLSDGTK
jgi:thiamine biosynthesis lipoprotein